MTRTEPSRTPARARGSRGCSLPKGRRDVLRGQHGRQRLAGHGHVDEVHGQDELFRRELPVLVDVREVPIQQEARCDLVSPRRTLGTAHASSTSSICLF